MKERCWISLMLHARFIFWLLLSKCYVKYFLLESSKKFSERITYGFCKTFVHWFFVVVVFKIVKLVIFYCTYEFLSQINVSSEVGFSPKCHGNQLKTELISNTLKHVVLNIDKVTKRHLHWEMAATLKLCSIIDNISGASWPL